MPKTETPLTDELAQAWTNSTEDKSIPPFDEVGAPESVWIKHARRLERERAELIEALESIVEHGTDSPEHVAAEQLIARIRKE